MAHRGSRTEVELVEEDEPTPARWSALTAAAASPDAAASPGTAASPDADGAPAPRRAPRRWRPVAAGAAALVLLLLGAQVVADARARAALAELRDVPGVRAPLPAALTEVWRVPGDRLPVPVPPTGDPLLGLRDTTTGTELVALDPATGADAWALPLTSAPAGAADVLGTPLPACDAPRSPGTARPARLVCLVTDAWSRDGGLVAQEVPATTSRLVVVRTSDGHVTAEHAVDVAPPAPGAAPDGADDGTPLPATSLVLIGDVAVLGHPVAPAGLLVRAVEVATGAELWRRAPAPAGPAAGEPTTPRVRAADGAVAVPAPYGFALVARDGSLLRQVRVGPGALTGAALGLPGDRGLLVREDDRWRLVTSRRDVPLPGDPLVATVDDGSAGALVLSRTPQGLHAVAADSGTQRWSVPLPDAEQALVVQGRVHVLAPDGLHAYDARTGAPLWQRRHADHDESRAGPVATDGEHLLVPVAGRDGGDATGVVHVALDDGHAVSTRPLPPGLLGVWPAPDPVLGWTGEGEAVGLG